MAGFLDMLVDQFDDQLVSSISKELGASNSQVLTALQGALPFLIKALTRNTLNDDGAESLHRAVEKDHDGSVLDQLLDVVSGTDNFSGNGILGHILGGTRGGVENFISQISGLSPQATSRLFAIVAPIIMGVLGRKQRSENLNQEGLAGILARAQQKQVHQAEEPSAMGGFIGQVLDADGDGQITDDLLSMGMRVFSGYLRG